MIWKYEEGHIYSTDEDGRLMAEVNYTRRNSNEIDIEHVYVDPELRGQGMAGQTMTVVAEYLRKNGLKATASCSYANSWLQKNENHYSDVIAKGLGSQAAACRIDGKH